MSVMQIIRDTSAESGVTFVTTNPQPDYTVFTFYRGGKCIKVCGGVEAALYWILGYYEGLRASASPNDKDETFVIG
jgi:hypothetical protein